MTELNYNLFLAVFLIVIVCVNFRVLYSQISFSNSHNSNLLSSSLQSIPSKLKIYESFNANDMSRTIKFDIPHKGTAVIKIHDTSGKTIRSYVYDKINSGIYEIKLNNYELASGNCYATLSCEDKKETIKLSETEY